MVIFMTPSLKTPSSRPEKKNNLNSNMLSEALEDGRPAEPVHCLLSAFLPAICYSWARRYKLDVWLIKSRSPTWGPYSRNQVF